jgi:type I restriction enzyme M protein
LIGAIIGDVAGSRFEFNNYRAKDFDFMPDDCFITDDTVMTCAVARALLDCSGDYSFRKLYDAVVYEMKEIGCRYPSCGYGGRFARWVLGDSSEPYNSFGNGAAMRVSPVVEGAMTLGECESMAAIVTMPTHNHPEGIASAMCVAGCAWLAKYGASKKDIEAYALMYYDLDRSVDDIRKDNYFSEYAYITTPQAIQCFLESNSFEDCIRNCISIGGDSDTIAATAGAIAEYYYGVPDDIKGRVMDFLPDDLKRIVEDFGTI